MKNKHCKYKHIVVLSLFAGLIGNALAQESIKEKLLQRKISTVDNFNKQYTVNPSRERLVYAENKILAEDFGTSIPKRDSGLSSSAINQKYIVKGFDGKKISAMSRLESVETIKKREIKPVKVTQAPAPVEKVIRVPAKDNLDIGKANVNEYVNEDTCEVSPVKDLRFTKLSNDSRQERLNSYSSATEMPENIGKIEVEVGLENLPADGQSENPVNVKVYDKKGNKLTKRAVVTVDINKGAEIRQKDSKTGHYGPGSGDIDPNKPGYQAKTDCSGNLDFVIVAPTSPVDVDLAIYAGKVEARGIVSYLPHLRDMIAVGLIQGIISKKKINVGSILSVNSFDTFEREISRNVSTSKDGSLVSGARSAFFLKGKILGETLLTASYDSDKDTKASLLRDINPYEFYPVYGDASLVGYEARSSERLYVRLDNKRNYLLYGDFNTGAGFSEMEGGGHVSSIKFRQLGAYNRTTTGVRGHLEDKSYAVNVYASPNRLRNKVSEFLMNGTSIVGTVDAKAVENTEKVEMVTYNRNSRNQIVTVKALERYKDYVFEAFSGRVLLLGSDINFFDNNGNPRSIRISYELEQSEGKKYYVYGADGQVKIANAVSVGASLVKDTNPQAPLEVASANIGIKISKNLEAIVEAAKSKSSNFILNGVTKKLATLGVGETEEKVNGSANRVEVNATTDFIDAKMYGKTADRKFYNPDSGVLAGTKEYGGSIAIKPTKWLHLFAEGSLFQDNSTVDNGPKQNNTAVGVRAALPAGFKVHLSLRNYKEDKGLGQNLAMPVNYGNYDSTAANAGITKITNANDRNTSTVRAGVSYTTPKNSEFEIAVESGKDKNITSKTDNVANKIILTVSTMLAEKAKLYARYEQQKNLGSALGYTQGDKGSSFNIGLESRYLDNGRLYSEYRMRSAVSGQDVRSRDIQQAVGVANTWALLPGLRGSLNAEYLNVLSGSARKSAAVGGGLDYVGSETWKLSTRLEGRRLSDVKDKSVLQPGDLTEDQIVHTISASAKVSPSTTLLAKNYLLQNRYKQNADGTPRGNLTANDFKVGVAYRPVYNNYWNMIAALGHKTQKDESSTSAESYKVTQASLLFNVHPQRSYWVTGKLAGKVRSDKLNLQGNVAQNWLTYSAGLASLRLNYDITDKWDMGVMGSVLLNKEYRTRSTAFGVETGYQVAENLWLTGGYNFSGFSDPDLTGADYTLQGGYLRFNYKFDENLFDGNNPNINLTLNGR